MSHEGTVGAGAPGTQSGDPAASVHRILNTTKTSDVWITYGVVIGLLAGIIASKLEGNPFYDMDQRIKLSQQIDDLKRRIQAKEGDPEDLKRQLEDLLAQHATPRNKIAGQSR